MPIVLRKLYTNRISIQLKTKELLIHHCGCHGNIVTKAMRYVADAYCPKEAPCQIWSKYDLRQRSYKVRKLMSPFQLAKHHGTTSCHRKVPLFIGTTSCYDLLLSRLPLVIETTFCYRNYLLLVSCYRKHLLLSRLLLIIWNTSCYRDYLLLSETPLVIEMHFCQTRSVISKTILSYFCFSCCLRSCESPKSWMNHWKESFWMRMRTGFDTDERKSRFSIDFCSLTSTCRGRVFSLNSKEITLNLLAIVSIH